MIELKQIRKDYGERTVIKNQSLFHQGQRIFCSHRPKRQRQNDPVETD